MDGWVDKPTTFEGIWMFERLDHVLNFQEKKCSKLNNDTKTFILPLSLPLRLKMLNEEGTYFSLEELKQILAIFKSSSTA